MAWKTPVETGRPQSRNRIFLRSNWVAPKNQSACQETASYPRQKARWLGQFWAPAGGPVSSQLASDSDFHTATRGHPKPARLRAQAWPGTRRREWFL